jgi:hypothetical protein
MPDNETINRHIHEMMDKCWHRFEPYRAIHGNHKCLENCGATRYTAEPMDYCSDDSPRRLLNEAVDKAVGMVGPYIFGRALAKQIDLSLPQDFNGVTDNELPSRVTFIASASAQQIATAIYNATKEEGK